MGQTEWVHAWHYHSGGQRPLEYQRLQMRMQALSNKAVGLTPTTASFSFFLRWRQHSTVSYQDRSCGPPWLSVDHLALNSLFPRPSQKIRLFLTCPGLEKGALIFSQQEPWKLGIKERHWTVRSRMTTKSAHSQHCFPAPSSKLCQI